MSVKKLTIALLILIALIAGGLTFMIWGWGTILRSECGNYLIKEVPSPDGRVKVVVFQRDCGATTGFSTQVSILQINKRLPNEPGNIFRADTNHGKAPSGPGGGPEVEVNWEKGTQLNIIYDNRAMVFHKESILSGIAVRYETKTR